jgi:hypothetical protein
VFILSWGSECCHGDGSSRSPQLNKQKAIALYPTGAADNTTDDFPHSKCLLLASQSSKAMSCHNAYCCIRVAGEIVK